jgi:RNA polymerase sigma factor (TIGR02999 family)
VTDAPGPATAGTARHSTDELFPLVYEELRQLAAAKIAQEAPGQTLQATALVHEVFVRLERQREQGPEPCWDSRTHFFFAAAEAMRRILVDHARRKQALKRGGQHDRLPLDGGNVAAPEVPEDVLALDEALEKLAARDAAAAQLVKLRYFSGLGMAEAAQLLGVSTRTADRLWAYARAWLRREIAGDSSQRTEVRGQSDF